MSTRAIIGIQNNDGTITGAWQWNDGMNIASLLRREFDTLEKTQELIKNGVWNNIISQKSKDPLRSFIDWTKRANSDYYLVAVGNCYLLKEKPCDTAEFCFGDDEGITVNADGSMTFETFEVTNGQDINYLYLFYPEANEWKIYR